MNLLNKLTIKNLKLNKKRTTVTIIGIMLSVALITAVATMYMSGLNSLIIYEKSLKGNFHAVFYNVEKSDIENIRNNNGVEEVFLTSEIGYAKLNTKNENKPYAYIMGFDKNSLKNLSVTLKEGRLPKNDNEIVIPSTLETNGRVKYKVGDTINLQVGTRMSEGAKLNQDNPYNEVPEETIENTTDKTYKIVGIIKRPATNIEPYTAPGYTFITYLDSKKMDNLLNVYVLYNKKGSKNYAKVTANILEVDENLYEKYLHGEFSTEKEFNEISEQINKAKYSINLNEYLIVLENDPVKNSGIGGLQYVVYIVCAIIVFTSVFCIKNSFDISITEKIKQYGMLRSIGATKKQIKKNVLYEASILGTIGIPLGLLLGNLASYILIVITNYLLKDNFVDNLRLHLTLSPLAYLFATILGIITIYLSAIRSAKKAEKVNPIDSIRNSSNIKINARKLKTPAFIESIFGIGGKISYKNIKRNKKRYRVTILSIIVSVSSFISLSYFMNTFMDSVNKEISHNEYNITYNIKAKDEETALINKINETTKLDNISNFSIIKASSLKIDNPSYSEKVKKLIEGLDGDYITIVSIGNEQYKKYIKKLNLNYEDIKDKGIIVDNIRFFVVDDNKETIKYDGRLYSYQINDTITGTYETLKQDKLNITIGAISNDRPFGLKNQYDEKYIVVSDEFYNKYIEDNFYYSLYFDSNKPNKLQDDIDNILKNEEYFLNNEAENVETMKRLVLLIGIFLYGFIAVITLIGLTNIFNTITTNMELRKPEFAMLKSIGMTTKEFNKMIRLESIFICLKSLLFGLPIGLSLSFVIYKLLGQSEGFKFNLPIKSILIVCLFVFILIYLLMKYSINKINKQNTIETIRNENI